MTLQVEVDDGNHNCRCYELQNRDISVLSDIVGTHSKAQNVELVVQSINDNRPKTNGKSRNYKLDATTLFRSSNLSKLNLQLGGQIVLEISAPFYMPIQELALVEVAISLYDFAILIRAVSLSLHHLYLEKLRILDSTSSNDFLLELQRVRALSSLRIDLPLSEVYPSLSEKKGLTLFVSSVALEFFLNDLTSNSICVFTHRLNYKHRFYSSCDLRLLEANLEDRRKRTKTTNGPRVRVVIGLPQNWARRPEQCKSESILTVGNVEIARLIQKESDGREETTTRFKLQL